jgi:hypothetical protein
LILWCGPVVLTDEFRSIDWYGRDVRIVTIAGAGSGYFAGLGNQFKDAEGRILPALLRRYTPRDVKQLDKVVMGAYSAGWGLLNAVARVDADRERLSAMMLSDACFGGGKSGYEKFAADAAAGKRLMVSTTAHTTPGTYPSGRESWEMVWNATIEATGKRPRNVTPPAPVPPASGGWRRLGSSLYWGDYTVPGSPRNQGNDFTHEQHHYMAPEVWQAYLAPYLAGRGQIPWLPLAAGAAVGAAAGYAAYTLTRS